MRAKSFWAKKGIFFTLAATGLAVVILLSFTVYRKYEMKEDIDNIGIRINTINNFIKDVEQDLENGLYIASFRAFTSMNQYIATNGSYISNLEGSFKSLILDGTINSQEISLMDGNTFTEWTKKIKEQADKIGILVNFTIIE